MILKKGEVLAFKTDTVWGFGADVCDIEAVDKIYEIKKRDLIKPLILMSNSINHLEEYIEYIPNYAYELIEKYLPGGLTLIFKKSKYCPYNVTRNLETVGIRIPDSVDFFNLIENINAKVLATTSCNLSSNPPVKNYKEAYNLFKDKATIIKPLKDSENENIPSTVILCEEKGYKILREGMVKL